MGKIVNFSSEQEQFSGYLAESLQPGPAVIVIQEWWGLVGHIKSVCDRFAQAGFNALAPDFYHGESTAEPDVAGSLMMALDVPKSAKVIKSASDFLINHSNTESSTVGVVGFCMGGQLALFAAGIDHRISACVNYYGIHPNIQPNFAAYNCSVLAFFADQDEYNPQSAIERFDQDLLKENIEHTLHIYPNTHHAFFNDDRPEVYDKYAAEDSWTRMLDLFNARVKE